MLEGSFDGCELNYIPKTNNIEADELANTGSTRGPVPPGVFLESISQRSIKVQTTAPEAAINDDTTEPAQVASASPSEGNSSQAVEPIDPTTLEGPAWIKPFL